MATARNVRRFSIGLVIASLVLVVADGAGYLWFIHRQHGGGPAWWFVAGLGIVIVLGVASVVRAVSRPVVPRVISAVILLVLGVLGIFSFGLPLIVAAILMLIALAINPPLTAPRIPQARGHDAR